MEIDLTTAKKRIANLFNYIKEIKKRIDSPIISEREYDWILTFEKLPNHPNIQIAPTDDVILKVKRPEEKKCPPPPKELVPWIKPSWKKISKEVEVLQSINEEDKDGRVKTIFFKDIQGLDEIYKKWLAEREAWKQAELPSEAVRNVFSKLHELKAKISSGSEKVQLYLADGILTVKSPVGDVHHPILFKEAGIELDTTKNEPEFIVTRPESNSFLYVALFRAIGINGTQISLRNKEFEELSIDPDQNGKITDFLRSLVHHFWQDGEYSESPVSNTDHPTIYRELKLILGKKQDHFIDQIDSFLKKLKSLDEIPASLESVVGIFNNHQLPPPVPEGPINPDQVRAKIKRDYYLTKEYNLEQKRIIDLLDEKGCVSVQGPPGTGKSHTIANLIGHLLAKGNSVLVSSYSTKALNVIREKVVDDLRPLCVSVLEKDSDSKKELEQSVNFIDSMLTSNNILDLERIIDDLIEKRSRFEYEIESLENEFASSILNEYKPISYLGDAIMPKDAARFISHNREQNLIPHPICDATPPISDHELINLKKIVRNITKQEHDELLLGIPSLGNLITPDEFDFYIKEKDHLNNDAENHDAEMIQKVENNSTDSIDGCLKAFTSMIDSFDIEEEWHKYIIETLLLGDNYAKIVKDFCESVEVILEKIDSHLPLVYQYVPSLESDHDYRALIKVLKSVASNGKGEARFGLFDSIFSKEVKVINDHAKVGNRKPSTAEEYLSLAHLLMLKQLRKELLFEWEKLLNGKIEKIPFDSNIESPEIVSKHLLNQINGLVESVKKFQEAVGSLLSLGLQWPSVYHYKLKAQESGKYRTTSTIINEFRIVLIPCFEHCLKKAKLREYSKKIELTKREISNDKFKSSVAKNLKLSIDSFNPESYRRFFKETYYLSEKYEQLLQFERTVGKLSISAPNFFKGISKRELDDVLCSINSFSTSWKLGYLDSILEDRNKVKPMEIQEKIAECKLILKNINADLVRNLTFKNQIIRTKPEQRQALRGWVQTQNKITKQGRGVLDQQRIREARKQLRTCKPAVPVWIMPLAKVLDNFSLVEDHFDVLIIDEASQADLTNLPVLTIAKKVIVVGDDKQVSPSAAGIKLQGIESLIDEFLGEIPNKQNYDYKLSLYDIACSSFGDTVRLSEHFRCVPEIIQFCNDLSYNGTIKVLRESKSNPTPPATIPYYAEGCNDDDINKVEAETIVSLVMAMKDRPQYLGSSFGIISLKGNKQHIYVDRLLRTNLSSKEYSDLKILCGKAPQFQGDERDVIFLSLVDSPSSDGPLHLQSETEDRKKEFNVAVSRARNQLWVIHSLNPERHLKPEDIRLRLLKHVANPVSLVEKHSETLKQAESPFEKEVHEDLMRAGYKFIPQYKIGAYRIDIVLFAEDGTRIAIECDGEKYHSSEEQVRNDLARQSVLERMKVKFIRIRGSAYYRNKKKTLEDVFSKLDFYRVPKDFKSTDDQLVYNEQYPLDIISDAEKIRKSLILDFEEESDDKVDKK